MHKMTCGHPSSKQAHIMQYGTMSDCSSYTSQPPQCHKNVSDDKLKPSTDRGPVLPMVLLALNPTIVKHQPHDMVG